MWNKLCDDIEKSNLIVSFKIKINSFDFSSYLFFNRNLKIKLLFILFYLNFIFYLLKFYYSNLVRVLSIYYYI